MRWRIRHQFSLLSICGWLVSLYVAAFLLDYTSSGFKVHPSHELRQLIAMTDSKCAQILWHFAKHTEKDQSLMISSAVLDLPRSSRAVPFSAYALSYPGGKYRLMI